MTPTLLERIAAGRSARQSVSRTSHADIGTIKRDPIELLKASSAGRVEELIPLRYGRMLESPFAFFRGSAILQTHDLANTPNSGFNFQICGDCHLANFGGFATPERDLLFDINDFDETHPGPWEWDLKRLVTSFFIGASNLAHSESTVEMVAYRAATSYQQHMKEYAAMSALDVWYDRITFERMLNRAATPDTRRRVKLAIKKAAKRTHDELLPKIGEHVDNRWIIRDDPPRIFHVGSKGIFLKRGDGMTRMEDWQDYLQVMIREYGSNLDANRRQLLERFVPQDFAFKVVGIGSVGTRCFILLMLDAGDNPLFLQIKQANASVIAAYMANKTAYKHQGRRVVEGQRLMQAASDQFIGWCTGPKGRHFYVRQLHDMKVSAQIELYDGNLLSDYAAICGWVLARAHARAGSMAPEISGYIGEGNGMADALVKYAKAYSKLVEKDYQVFVKACRSGKLEARTEADYDQDFSV